MEDVRLSCRGWIRKIVYLLAAWNLKPYSSVVPVCETEGKTEDRLRLRAPITTLGWRKF
jgi:hypothetical protein